MPTAARWAKMGPEEKQRYLTWTQGWKLRNKARALELARNSYLRKVGELVRVSPLENTLDRIALRARLKAAVRATRAKKARIKDAFTQFVTAEAHDLRELRNQATGILWHVDHIVPLKGKEASGLHIWSNLQVIPALDNLRKGAKNSFPN